MLNLLLAFIPDSALPVIIAGAGLLIMLGLVKPRTAFGFIGVFVLSIVTAPLIEAVFAELPLWLTALILVAGGFWAVRTVLEFTLGEHAAGHVIGTAFIATVRLLFLTLFFPVRVVVRALRSYRSSIR
ncbi:MAG TPA: hypothetical protein VK636_04710 [Gemmatimonadaceae bacterium]|nr:hypothetical protein [Gemmatimonadaceae bacterium]